jgi:hypothetical protein
MVVPHRRAAARRAASKVVPELVDMGTSAGAAGAGPPSHNAPRRLRFERKGALADACGPANRGRHAPQALRVLARLPAGNIA